MQYILESEEFNPPHNSFDQSTIYDPQPGFSVDFLSDGPEFLIGGLTSARRA